MQSTNKAFIRDKYKHIDLDVLHINIDNKMLTTISALEQILSSGGFNEHAGLQYFMYYSYKKMNVTCPNRYCLFKPYKTMFCIHEIIDCIEKRMDYYKYRREELVPSYRKDKAEQTTAFTSSILKCSKILYILNNYVKSQVK